MIGVGIIFPFMNIIINNNIIYENKYLYLIYNYFGFETENNFLILLSICLILLMIIKNIVLYLLHYIQQTFIVYKRIKLSNLMFRGYLKEPYEFHLNNNSILLWRNLNQIDEVITGIIQPLLILVAESTVITFILLMMLISQFKITIITILIILGPTAILHFFF